METVNFQILFDIAVMAAGALFGWILKTIWETLSDLQKSDKELTEKVNAIEVLVAGNYVRREEISKEFSELHKRLDSIMDKLNNR